MEETMSEETVSSHQPATTETHGSIMPFQITGFNHRLQQYMNQPLDQGLERRFAAALLTMRFIVPVQTTVRHASAKQPKPGLGLAVAITTYLADGQHYIPVFTDQLKMQAFLADAPQLEPFRSFEFTSEELMNEAKKLDLAGILINPGHQSFPLSQQYWDYIHQVAPIVSSEEEQEVEFKFRIIYPAPDKLQHALQQELKHARKAQEAWLIETKLKGEVKYDYTVVVDYHGDANEFQEKVARKLAKVAHRYLPHGSDILVGTLDDSMGAAVKVEIDPFYKRKRWFN